MIPGAPDPGAENLSIDPLSRALDRITRPPLLSVLAVAQLAMLAVLALAHLATLAPPDTIDSPGTGDFLAFWTGAVLLNDGMGAELYDYAVQREAQVAILGTRAPWFQPYLNPPLLAWPLSATVPLGYVAAFYLFCLACIAAFGVAMSALLRELPNLAPRPVDRFVALVLVAGYHPVIRTLVGGQNTPLTIALIAGLFVALRRGSWLIAGLLLGLLTYKPQYAIGLGLAVLALREYRVLAVGIGIGLLHSLLGAVVVGLDWPLRMLRLLATYGPLEREASAGMQFSWVRFASDLLPAPFGGLLGIIGAVLVLGLLVAGGLRIHVKHDRFPAYFALAVAGTMLASPHLQYYEAGLLIVPGVLLLDQVARQGAVSLRIRFMIAAAYVGYPLYVVGDRIGVQPLVMLLAAMFTWALLTLRQPELSPDRP